jgi:hemolysin activation/secretion protein
MAAALWGGGMLQAAQDAVAAPAARDAASDPGYAVDTIRLEYQRQNAGHPSLAEMSRGVAITLGQAPGGYAAPHPDLPAVTLTLADLAAPPAPPEPAERRFLRSGLQRLLEGVRDALLARGLMGVFVAVDPAHIDAQGRDLRPAGARDLRILVSTTVVTELRTLAEGERIAPEDRIDHPLHERIRAGSPIQPYLGASSQTDLLRRDLLDDYLFRLSRHPGRRVDAAVAPAEAVGGAALDYRVIENRPLSLYAETSNTGTEATDTWRQRFGLLHTQLTNRDDVLELAYTTATFDELHQVASSYEAPLGGWEGLRWRVFGAWSEFTASDVGLAGDDFTGRSWSAGAELVATVHQRRELFVDLVAGMRVMESRITSPGTGRGRETFYLPALGVRMEQRNDLRSTSAYAGVEWNVGGVDEADLDRLGRTAADGHWTVLGWDLGHAFYLEPLIDPAGWADPQTPSSSTLAHEVSLSFRGQHAFDRRLIAQLEQPMGGLTTVRGYPESITAGDTALVGTVEYRLHLPRLFAIEAEPRQFLGRPFRLAPQQVYGRPDWDLVFKGFLDVGHAMVSDALPGEGDETLVGAGLGVELHYRRNLFLRVEWGVAVHGLEDRDVDSGESRVHFVATLVY